SCSFAPMGCPSPSTCPRTTRAETPTASRGTSTRTGAARWRRCWTGTRPSRPAAARAASGSDAQGGGKIAQERDRREVRQLPGSRILRRYVLDLDRQPPELALHRDSMTVQGPLGRREDPDLRLLGSDTGQRQRGHHVDVRRKGAAGLGGGALEDQRLLRDRV